MCNSNLNKAKNAKQDEFYTKYEDIEKELTNYKNNFRNKIIYCNCDNPLESNFFKYFANNFESLELKKLISTYYSSGKVNPNMLEINNVKGYDGSIKSLLKNNENISRPLAGNGDFRSKECVDILSNNKDLIVVTNPPFSLFREFVNLLIENNTKFLIIGSQNALKYKEIFPLIKEEKIWLGVNNGSQEFMVPKTYDGTITRIDETGNRWVKLGNIAWYTNLKFKRKGNEMELSLKYKDGLKNGLYPKYKDYDAIDVSKVSDIPLDYDKEMGVPISYMTKHNPKLFEIIGELNHGCDNIYDFARPIVNSVEKFPRIIIKRRTEYGL